MNKNEKKETTKINSKTLIIILTSIIAVCMVVIIVLLCLLLKKPDDKSVTSGALSETSIADSDIQNESLPDDSDTQSETSASTENSSLTIGAPDESREAIEIVTKYGTLLYPKEWESNLRTEIIDEDVYKVEFYGTVEGKDEHKLFDLIFNGIDGYNLGTLKTESGEDVALNIVSYDFELDDTWTEDEQLVLYSMQEDINYTIGMLSESGNFTVS